MVRAGSAPGVELDRPLLRASAASCAAPRRSTWPCDASPGAIVSTRRLSERLARAAIAPAARRGAVGHSRSARIVDDARLARAGRRRSPSAGGEMRRSRPGSRRRGSRRGRRGSQWPSSPPEAERAARRRRAARTARAAWALLARRGFAPRRSRTLVGPLDETSLTAATIPTLSPPKCLHTERLFAESDTMRTTTTNNATSTQNPGRRETSSGALGR